MQCEELLQDEVMLLVEFGRKMNNETKFVAFKNSQKRRHFSIELDDKKFLHRVRKFPAKIFGGATGAAGDFPAIVLFK